MRHLISIIFLLVLVSPALAIPTVTCHCFQDRSFDPQHPAAVDPYLLANARNSLFAAAFRLEKSAVVRAVRVGSAPEELWVGHYLAEKTLSRKTGRPAKTLFDEVRSGGSWGKIFAATDLEPKGIEGEMRKTRSTAQIFSCSTKNAAHQLHADPEALSFHHPSSHLKSSL